MRGGRFVEAAAKFGLELLAAEVGVCHDEREAVNSPFTTVWSSVVVGGRWPAERLSWTDAPAKKRTLR